MGTPSTSSLHPSHRVVPFRDLGPSPIHQRLCGRSWRPFPIYSRAHLSHLLRKTFIPSLTTSTPVFQPLRHGILLIKTRLRELWPPHLYCNDTAGDFIGIADYLPLTFFPDTLGIGIRHARSCPTLRQSAPHSAKRWLPPSIVSPRFLMIFHSFVAFGGYFRVLTPRMTSSSTNKTLPASSTSSRTLA